MIFSCQRSLLSDIVWDMKIFKKINHILLILSFGFSTLFAEDGVNIPQREPNNEEVGEEILEEKIAPPEFPSLIDLSKRKAQPDPMPKYSSLYLFVFNVAMFTVGIAVVKGITGTRV